MVDVSDVRDETEVWTVMTWDQRVQDALRLRQAFRLRLRELEAERDRFYAGWDCYDEALLEKSAAERALNARGEVVALEHMFRLEAP